jgi:5'-phosphate synthase pdxT subunit
MTVGVLALQGGFAAHLRALHQLGVSAQLVRYPSELSGLSGLVLPGGESTTQLDLMARLELFEPLQELHERRAPILATCAGLIVVAKHVAPAQRSLGWLSVNVCRNAYGRQLDSFAARDDSGDIPLVFIRAPRITHVANEATVLARCQGEPVLVQQNNVVGATFHPELTENRSLYRRLFLEGISSSAARASDRH